MRAQKRSEPFLPQNKFVRVVAIVVGLLFLWIIAGGVRGAYIGMKNKPMKELRHSFVQTFDEWWRQWESAGIGDFIKDAKFAWAQDKSNKESIRKAISDARSLCEKYQEIIDAKIRNIQSQIQPAENIIESYVRFKQVLQSMKQICDSMECISIIESGTIPSDDREMAATLFMECSTLERLEKFKGEKYKEYSNAVLKFSSELSLLLH